MSEAELTEIERRARTEIDRRASRPQTIYAAGAMVPGPRQVVRDPAWTPQLLLRIGWLPPGTEELPPTPRRPLTDVVAALDTDCGLGE